MQTTFSKHAGAESNPRGENAGPSMRVVAARYLWGKKHGAGLQRFTAQSRGFVRARWKRPHRKLYVLRASLQPLGMPLPLACAK